MSWGRKGRRTLDPHRPDRAPPVARPAPDRAVAGRRWIPPGGGRFLVPSRGVAAVLFAARGRSPGGTRGGRRGDRAPAPLPAAGGRGGSPRDPDRRDERDAARLEIPGRGRGPGGP